ncbi:MAG: diacylglycerol kinase family protein [Gemmatimonadaceae bacterium]
MRIIVYNPRGGAAIWTWRLQAALRVLRALPGPHVLVRTEALDMSGPVTRALAAFPETAQVVACGGDGTVAACAAAVAAAGRAVPIAIVPTGTSNVLASELGLPASPASAARLLAGAMRPVPFRTWNVNGRQMLLQLGIGFDGLLMWRTPRRVKRALGFVGVMASALRQGVMFDYPEVRVTGERDDGSALDAVATSVMVANARRWAGPRIVVPSADPSDDLLDVLLLTYRNFGQLTRFWISILLPGTPHLTLPFVRHVRMRRLRVDALGRAVEAHLDGEPVIMTPIDVTLTGRAHLLAPLLSHRP